MIPFTLLCALAFAHFDIVAKNHRLIEQNRALKTALESFRESSSLQDAAGAAEREVSANHHGRHHYRPTHNFDPTSLSLEEMRGEVAIGGSSCDGGCPDHAVCRDGECWLNEEVVAQLSSYSPAVLRGEEAVGGIRCNCDAAAFRGRCPLYTACCSDNYCWFWVPGTCNGHYGCELGGESAVGGEDYRQITSRPWSGLTANQQAAATTLGVTKHMWDTDGTWPVEGQYWDELPPMEQEAAYTLGYNEETWNATVEAALAARKEDSVADKV